MSNFGQSRLVGQRRNETEAKRKIKITIQTVNLIRARIMGNGIIGKLDEKELPQWDEKASGARRSAICV